MFRPKKRLGRERERELKDLSSHGHGGHGEIASAFKMAKFSSPLQSASIQCLTISLSYIKSILVLLVLVRLLTRSCIDEACCSAAGLWARRRIA